MDRTILDLSGSLSRRQRSLVPGKTTRLEALATLGVEVEKEERRVTMVRIIRCTEMAAMTSEARRLIWLTGAVMVVVASVARPVPAQVTFDWVTVANPGNPADTLVMNKGAAPDFTTGYGAVDYVYQISKHNVTNAQYAQFLNAVDATGSNALRIYDTRMSSDTLGVAYTGGIDRDLTAESGAKYAAKPGQDNYPAIWINWASGARFVNWLANGQGAGGTESGVYDMALIPSNNSFATPPPRAAGATFFLPSENEFYKAAYYDPAKNGGAGGYWTYGTRSDTAPLSMAPPGTANSANIGAGTDGQSAGTLAATMATTGAGFDASVNYLTAVGAYAAATSAYGLYDVEGLVYNWTEATRTSFGNELPIYRGGSWRYNEGASGAAFRNVYSGAGAPSYAWYGLRIASLLAPLPIDIVVDVEAGSQTQAQAGFPTLTAAEVLSVTKTGAGTLIFDAVNSYTGDTLVAAGTLALTGSGAIASSALVELGAGATFDVTALPGGFVVADGQTLGGLGSVNGSVVFGPGSTLSPGAVPSAAADGPMATVATVPEPGAYGTAVMGLGLALAGGWCGTRRGRSRRP
jgi:sulfatase modifying factor 1